MEGLKTVLFFGIAVKAIIEYISTWFVNGNIEWKQIASFLFGELIAFAYNLDAFEAMGISAKIPFISIVLTGLVISGGSNLIYDIFNFTDKKIVLKAEEEIADINEKG